MDKDSFLGLRISVYFLVFVFSVMDMSQSIAQENMTINFENIQPRFQLNGMIGGKHPVRVQKTVSAVLQLERSKLPFRQHLMESGQQEQVSILKPIWGGILGGAVGFFGGGMLGVASAENCSDCGFGSIGRFLLGASIGEALVLPLGVHYGNKRRGKLGFVFLTSLAMAGGGLMIMDRLNADESWFLLVPVLQIGATVAVERITARHR